MQWNLECVERYLQSVLRYLEALGGIGGTCETRGCHEGRTCCRKSGRIRGSGAGVLAARMSRGSCAWCVGVCVCVCVCVCTYTYTHTHTLTHTHTRTHTYTHTHISPGITTGENTAIRLPLHTPVKRRRHGPIKCRRQGPIQR